MTLKNKPPENDTTARVTEKREKQIIRKDIKYSSFCSQLDKPEKFGWKRKKEGERKREWRAQRVSISLLTQ